jgi:hypothetical protein
VLPAIARQTMGDSRAIHCAADNSCRSPASRADAEQKNRARWPGFETVLGSVALLVSGSESKKSAGAITVSGLLSESGYQGSHFVEADPATIVDVDVEEVDLGRRFEDGIDVILVLAALDERVRTRWSLTRTKRQVQSVLSGVSSGMGSTPGRSLQSTQSSESSGIVESCGEQLVGRGDRELADPAQIAGSG